MLESAIENGVRVRLQKLRPDVKFLKFSPLGEDGYPDRIVLSGGRALFVEYKRPGEKPRKLQLYRQGQLREMGFVVMVHDNIEQSILEIEEWLNVATN